MTGTRWRTPLAPATSTAYAPPDWAKRASTGTTRTLLTLPVVIVTFTGAWSHVPVAVGSVGLTSTVMVGELLALAELLEDGAVATVPTEEITPGVVRLFGRVMVTLSPTFISDCWAASRAMVTWRVVVVPCMIDWPAWTVPPNVTGRRRHPHRRRQEHGLSQRERAVLGHA